MPLLLLLVVPGLLPWVVLTLIQTLLIIASPLKWYLCFICVCVLLKACRWFFLTSVAELARFLSFSPSFWLKRKACRNSRLFFSPRNGGDGLLEADGNRKWFRSKEWESKSHGLSRLYEMRGLYSCSNCSLQGSKVPSVQHYHCFSWSFPVGRYCCRTQQWVSVIFYSFWGPLDSLMACTYPLLSHAFHCSWTLQPARLVGD